MHGKNPATLDSMMCLIPDIFPIIQRPGCSRTAKLCFELMGLLRLTCSGENSWPQQAQQWAVKARMPNRLVMARWGWDLLRSCSFSCLSPTPLTLPKGSQIHRWMAITRLRWTQAPWTQPKTDGMLQQGLEVRSPRLEASFRFPR